MTLSCSTSPALPAAWRALLRVHACAARAVDSQLQAELGLTLTDSLVLEALATSTEGHVRPVDLAAVAGMTPSGMTRLLSGLEHAGLVCRTACPNDRRVMHAQLTAEGRRMADKATELQAAVAQESLTTLSPSEQQQLHDLLARLLP